MSAWEGLTLILGGLLGVVLGIEMVIGGVLPRKYVDRYREARDLAEHLARQMGRPWRERILTLFDEFSRPSDPQIRGYLQAFRRYQDLKREVGEDWERLEVLERENLSPELLAGLPVDLETFRKYCSIRREMDGLGREIFVKLKKPWEALEFYQVNQGVFEDWGTEWKELRGRAARSFREGMDRIQWSRGGEALRSRRKGADPNGRVRREPPKKSQSHAPPPPRSESYGRSRDSQSAPGRSRATRKAAKPERSRWDGEPHEVLGVPRDADTALILRAYRDLVRKYHPDVAGSRFAVTPEEANRITIRLNHSKSALLKARRMGMAG